MNYITKKNKLIFIILIDVSILFAIVYFTLIRAPIIPKINGTYMQHPLDIAEFHLTDNYGQSFTKERLKGHWTMVFFGFTSCPMICPTTMTALNEMYENLQQNFPPEKLPQVIFISVDPKRDSAKKLTQFVHTFNPQFIGARARIEEIIALEKQLHITVSNNVLRHSMEILLINPNAQVQAYFSYPHRSQQLVGDYKRLIGE